MSVENSQATADRLDTFDSTLANNSELVLACLEAAGARSVAEVGAEHGLFTEELLAWGARVGAERTVAIDPAPGERLLDLDQASPELELILATSHEALASLELPDAVILDGDHNYFTVSRELELIAARAGGSKLPLLLFHDVGWPLARRDSYHEPDAIPEAHRQPLTREAFLVPGEAGTARSGLYYRCVAAHEGGPGNGVLTAIEDFIADRQGLRMAVAPPFFGFGVLWDADAPWAEAVGAAIGPWDRNPLLERLEAKRIAHMVAEFENLQATYDQYTADYVHRQRVIGRLLPILDSGAFGLAERISAVRQRGRPNVSRAKLADLVADLAADDIDVEYLRAHPQPEPEGVTMRAYEQTPERPAHLLAEPPPPDVASEAS